MVRSVRTLPEGQTSRQQILDCAARVFRENGYAAATLRDIAAAAGIRTASIYYHFGSKDEIVAEVLNIAVRTVFAEVRKNMEGLETAAPDVRIEAAVAGHLRSIFETDDYNGASIRIYAQLPPHIGELTLEPREEYISYWKDLLEDARKAGFLREVDLTLLRLFLFGVMNWTPQWYKPGNYSLNEIAKKICEVFFFGAAAVRQASDSPKTSE
jgi:AcrR family transcriptional regulator